MTQAGETVVLGKMVTCIRCDGQFWSCDPRYVRVCDNCRPGFEREREGRPISDWEHDPECKRRLGFEQTDGGVVVTVIDEEHEMSAAEEAFLMLGTDIDETSEALTPSEELAIAREDAEFEALLEKAERQMENRT